MISPEHTRLVRRIAKRYRHCKSMQQEDLEQEGYLGLMLAQARYDAARGSFEAFAAWCIRSTIAQAIRTQDAQIRVPRDALLDQRKVSKVTRHSAEKPSVRRIATATGLSVERVERVSDVPREPLSLETPIGIDSTIGDTLAVNPTEYTGGVDLSSLDPKEREAIELHYVGELSFSEIGKKMGVTKQRIGQITQTAIGKLRRRRAA